MSTTYNALASALTQFENSSHPNNPGALENNSGQMIDFPSYDAGYSALLDKLGFDASGQSSTYNPNMTLQDFVNKYTGTQTGDPNNYAPGLASQLGVPTSTTLGQLADQNLYQSQTGNNPVTIPNVSGLSAPTYSPEASGVAAASGSVPANTTAPGLANVDTSGGGWFAEHIASITAIIIGIVLIGGAIFTFKAVSNTVVTVAKKGAEVAATSAA